MNINDYLADKNEKPLDNIVSDGGFCSIFRSIGAIGDSLSSGEFESINDDGTKGYHDCFDFSWGQYISRLAGTKVYNFSRGGMTAKEFCQSFGNRHGYFAEDTACAAYIVAMGVNDYCNANMTLGSADDVNIDNPFDHPDTVAGWYGELLLRYKAISPDAKFFLVSLPREIGRHGEEEKQIKFRDMLNGIIKKLENCYLIDLFEYAPAYDDKFREAFYLNGHMNPCGYLLTAKMFCSYIDWIIRNNPKDFEKVGFIKAQYNPTDL